MAVIKTTVKYLALAALFGIAGCQSTTAPFSAGVDEHGQEIFITSYKVRGGLTDWGDVKRKPYEQATVFCSKKGMKMREVQMTTSGVRGWSPQEAALRFTCVR